MFDLTALHAQPAELKLRHPGTGAELADDAGNPVTITIVGEHSPQFSQAERKAANARFQRSQDGKKPTAEDVEAEHVDLMVACTIGWSANLAMGGQPFVFSAENARRLYTEWPWVLDQVSKFFRTRGHFFTK